MLLTADVDNLLMFIVSKALLFTVFYINLIVLDRYGRIANE